MVIIQNLSSKAFLGFVYMMIYKTIKPTFCWPTFRALNI